MRLHMLHKELECIEIERKLTSLYHKMCEIGITSVNILNVNYSPKRDKPLNYNLKSLIADGSFGAVLLGVDNNGNDFAIKRVKLNSEIKMKKLKKEVDVLTMCRGHKFIIELIDFHEIDDEAYMVFEKAHGDLLQRLLAGKTYSETSIARGVGCIASALKHLHDLHISHRDLKPDNILCFSIDDIFPLKLCDFDLCSYRPTESVQRNEFKSQLGSIQYMAPEVASVWLGEKTSYTKECDLWSLGVIIYAIFFRVTAFAFPSFDNCPKKCDGECEECETVQVKKIQTGNYKVVDGFNALSEGAKDLLMNLLKVEPHLRPTPEEVTKHKWIINHKYY